MRNNAKIYPTASEGACDMAAMTTAMTRASAKVINARAIALGPAASSANCAHIAVRVPTTSIAQARNMKNKVSTSKPCGIPRARTSAAKIAVVVVQTSRSKIEN
jgi:hypothetical protein